MVKPKIEVRFKGRVTGGPFDGATLTYEGTTEDENWWSKIATITAHGHKYAITSYDRETNQAEIKW